MDEHPIPLGTDEPSSVSGFPAYERSPSEIREAEQEARMRAEAEDARLAQGLVVAADPVATTLGEFRRLTAHLPDDLALQCSGESGYDVGAPTLFVGLKRNLVRNRVAGYSPVLSLEI